MGVELMWSECGVVWSTFLERVGAVESAWSVWGLSSMRAAVTRAHATP